MKAINPANVGFTRVLLATAILVSCTFSSAYSQSQKITLLVQQTPSDGGQVTPNEGSYKYDQNSEVKITATPNKGYKFLHWLGDVSNQESISTTVRLDKPKLVIAVFEPVYNSLDIPSSHNSIGGGGGSSAGLMYNRVNFSNNISIGGGGGGKQQEPTVIYEPVGDIITPVVPEPATGLLLALGSLFTFTRRRRGKVNPSRN